MNGQTPAPVRCSPQRPALVLFGKAPRPGQVKTRLCPPLTAAEAAALYGAFLRRIVRPHPAARTYLYGTPADALDELRPFAPEGVEVRAQCGADLWQRLTACFAELFAAGHDAVVLRNTDSPDLPDARVDEALAACGPGRVVLGPDRGGGYYLIGLTWPAGGSSDLGALFALGGTPPQDVFAQTCRRAGRLGFEVVTLPVEADVDTFADLLAMWAARAPAAEP